MVQPAYSSSSVIFDFSSPVIWITESLKFGAKTLVVGEADDSGIEACAIWLRLAVGLSAAGGLFALAKGGEL
jgi:hypothetical protein